MPEEINRVVADHLSTLLFCPTSAAIAHLAAEGITANVHATGDVMYDTALMCAEKAQGSSSVFSRYSLRPHEYVLVTIHRAENTDDPSRLSRMLSGLTELAKETAVVFPMHPRTKKMIAELSLGTMLSGVTVCEPAGFLDMVCLERNARLILTDSGGVQKEAYFHRVPCVTLRDETEWVETVEAGWNALALDIRPESIVALARKMWQPNPQRKTIADYGDGNAAQIIAELLAKEV
jgi:UDP-GlcNAc3NAcA epimerase